MAFAKYVIGSGGLKGVSYEEQENIVSSLINNLILVMISMRLI